MEGQLYCFHNFVDKEMDPRKKYIAQIPIGDKCEGNNRKCLLPGPIGAFSSLNCFSLCLGTAMVCIWFEFVPCVVTYWKSGPQWQC